MPIYDYLITLHIGLGTPGPHPPVFSEFVEFEEVQDKSAETVCWYIIAPALRVSSREDGLKSVCQWSSPLKALAAPAVSYIQFPSYHDFATTSGGNPLRSQQVLKRITLY